MRGADVDQSGMFSYVSLVGEVLTDTGFGPASLMCRESAGNSRRKGLCVVAGTGLAPWRDTGYTGNSLPIRAGISDRRRRERVSDCSESFVRIQALWPPGVGSWLRMASNDPSSRCLLYIS